MPTYDYKCNNCDTINEKLVPLKHFDELQECESCGGQLERLFSMIGATHGDEAPWFRTTTEFLKDGDPRTMHYHPVENRTEYNKLMKEKGLTPVG